MEYCLWRDKVSVPFYTLGDRGLLETLIVRHGFSQPVQTVYSSFNSLVRQTSFSDDRADLFFCTMWPAKENRLSHGTAEAGVAKYLCAIRASLPWAPVCADHHCRGHVAVDRASTSDSDSDPISRRAIFFFGGSIFFLEGCGTGFLSFSISLSFCHTSSFSALGRHLRSLNLGSRAVATFSHERFVFSFRLLRSSVNAALYYVGRVNIWDFHYT